MERADVRDIHKALLELREQVYKCTLVLGNSFDEYRDLPSMLGKLNVDPRVTNSLWFSIHSLHVILSKYESDTHGVIK